MSQLPTEVRQAGWISFWADVASEMAYPVIPLFLIGALKAPATVLGLIEGAALALISVMRGVSGWHSDLSGRRLPYIRLGYGLSAVAKPLMAFAWGWPSVLGARLVDRFGKGVRTTARDALIADVAVAGQEGQAFGFHRAMDSAGAVLGSLIGFLMLELLPGQYRLIFLLTFIPGCISVGIAYLLKEPDRHHEADRAKWTRGPLPRSFWLATLVLAIFALANSSDTFILLKARDAGLSAPFVALTYVLYNATYSALSYPLGSLSDRIGKAPLLIGGWLAYAAIYLAMANAPALWFWGLLPLYGLYMAATDGVSKALVGRIAPATSRGTALGIHYFTSGVMALAASLIAGLLWDRVSHAAPFHFGAASALVASAVGLLVFPRISSSQRPTSRAA